MQKIVAIKVIKGRLEEDIILDSEMRQKIRVLAEKEYKNFISEIKESAKKSYGSQKQREEKWSRYSINQWIYMERDHDTPISKITQTFLPYFKNVYNTEEDKIKIKICREAEFGYNNLKKTLIYPLKHAEVSIEKQILDMINEGWLTKGEITASGDKFFQTMVKYEEPPPELKLEVRRKPVNNN